MSSPSISFPVQPPLPSPFSYLPACSLNDTLGIAAKIPEQHRDESLEERVSIFLPRYMAGLNQLFRPLQIHRGYLNPSDASAAMMADATTIPGYHLLSAGTTHKVTVARIVSSLDFAYSSQCALFSGRRKRIPVLRGIFQSLNSTHLTKTANMPCIFMGRRIITRRKVRIESACVLPEPH
jgi:hypothetical protein